MPLTPVLNIVMAFEAVAAMQPIDSSPVTGAQSVLAIPDAIAPAVMPYAACLYAVRGLPFLLGRERRQVTYEKSNGNCSEERRHVAADAITLLKNGPVPGGGAPSAYVENELAKLDAFVERLPVRQGSTRSRRAPPVGVPFLVEDEVKPAYDRYEDCLKTQVSYATMSVETILSVFRQAMERCWSVRAAGVVEAENALVKRGWNAAERARAAENSFATADQSWMELGQQFRDSFIHRLNEPAGGAKRVGAAPGRRKGGRN